MSVWHWLVALIVLVPGAVLLVFALRGIRREKRAGLGVTPGLKGWLLLLAVGLWLAVPRAVLVAVNAFVSADPRVAGQFPILPVIDAAFGLAGGLLAFVAALLLSRHSRRFGRAFVALYAFSVLAAPLSILIALGVLRGVYGVALGLGDALAEFSARDHAQWAGGIVGGGLWLLYVLRSRRVRITCVD